jgi:hypothetical protein
MSRILSIIGLLFTALYFAFVYWLLAARWIEILAMTPNNIGDLLAGIFGPLAILWLVLGFFQQGIELRQNTRALDQQAQELKNSVEQQKELVAIAKRQVDTALESLREERERHVQAASPSFHFSANGSAGSGASTVYHLLLLNAGAPVANVQIRPSRPLQQLSNSHIPLCRAQTQYPVELQFDSGQPTDMDYISITYDDALGHRGEIQFIFDMGDNGALRQLVERAP